MAHETSSHYLSKSRYTHGLQCLKLLWLQVHKPDLAGEPDEKAQRIFAIGHAVGKLAHQLFPGGTLVAEGHEHLAEAIQSTRAAADSGAKALFEATVSHNRVLCRADILERLPGKKGEWALHEVKSSTEVKDQYIPDIAVQRYCLEGAGFRIRKANLVHVNRDYVRKGPVNPSKLFVTADQTAAVQKHMREVEKNVGEQLAVLAKAAPPDIAPGPHCTDPYDCPFYDYCNKDPGPGSVQDLPRGRSLVPALLEAGITRLADIPVTRYCLSEVQESVIASAKARKPVLDKTALRAFLATLEYPLYHLDFETAASAIPMFDNSRPWQNVPFQVSLHVQKRPGSPATHHFYLAESRQDPRPEICEFLLDRLGTKGTILAWSVSYERRMVSEMARDFPKYRDRLDRVVDRLADLMEPFSKGWYADYRFRGSASLKAVTPVMAPSFAYDKLEIQDGDTASARAERWFSGDMDEKEWRGQRKRLLAYCGNDTAVMVEILDKLCEAAG